MATTKLVLILSASLAYIAVLGLLGAGAAQALIDKLG